MEITNELVDKIAHLSRLHFDETEKGAIKQDLQRMIQFVEKLNELDTSGVEPLLHMTDNVNILREDNVKGSISREEGLRNAPLPDDQFFKVPKVIKK
ncbi:Asp-tRNA(Asn)/Glu-tRNA(Gln) amidotransferase subunit GatC [Ferruginibacter albus]|uniref:Asp-tRNA(Asn)/Glu-tRNA(Gln) amidotransferase subunit GatC n=1 Tax=Ferruginibacter albus TaxID=2875540 RepID=UPI001CC6D937|nr:Asp-tRNA(Asn)/Glu-tRNA(Gln) amidotransferase subunit GatC [Ferruginibacter albus]UAY50744.1 Asp-tRNA(Asn)/Glu-tRNA(Gln) amidotransferase subunit GatC [Ferruginibacter albus]